MEKKIKLILITLSVCALLATACTPQKTDTNITQVAPTPTPSVVVAPNDQLWWLGVISHGEKMPLSAPYQVTMKGTVEGNQIQPLALSNNGHVVWSPSPFSAKFDSGNLSLSEQGSPITIKKVGTTLKDAFTHASQTYFPPSKKMPHSLLFTAPQFNTWIELTYNQNQNDILSYARKIVAQGIKPGVLMIDDTWQSNYGDWSFESSRFPDPQAMMRELHQLGFKVMLWIAPFVSADSPQYREIKDLGGFLKSDDDNTLPQMVPWWNGQSAVLDLSNPVDIKWFKQQMNHLQETYGVDGFKFDAGDAEFYTKGKSLKGLTANEQAEKYAEIGLGYPLNEYRATWKMGGQPLAQRLRDKEHTWQDLNKLVPQMNLLGIMGYPFACPDMIGGGQFTSFLPGSKIDQELIVRSAQAHALMPMMQFSVAPWRVLDDTHLAAVKDAIATREKFVDYILSLAENAAATGEPIMRPLEYQFPHSGFLQTHDQFMIGDKLLVAPVLVSNSKNRQVKLPQGTWQGFDGKTYHGPSLVTINVELTTLPYFEMK